MARGSAKNMLILPLENLELQFHFFKFADSTALGELIKIKGQGERKILKKWKRKAFDREGRKER